MRRPITPQVLGEPAGRIQCTERVRVVESLVVVPEVAGLAKLRSVAAGVIAEVEGVAKGSERLGHDAELHAEVRG